MPLTDLDLTLMRMVLAEHRVAVVSHLEQLLAHDLETPNRLGRRHRPKLAPVSSGVLVSGLVAAILLGRGGSKASGSRQAPSAVPDLAPIDAGSATGAPAGPAPPSPAVTSAPSA